MQYPITSSLVSRTSTCFRSEGLQSKSYICFSILDLKNCNPKLSLPLQSLRIYDQYYWKDNEINIPANLGNVCNPVITLGLYTHGHSYTDTVVVLSVPVSCHRLSSGVALHGTSNNAFISVETFCMFRSEEQQSKAELTTSMIAHLWSLLLQGQWDQQSSLWSWVNVCNPVITLVHRHWGYSIHTCVMPGTFFGCSITCYIQQCLHRF